MSKTKNKTAAAALKILKEGNKRFVADKLQPVSYTHLTLPTKA